MSDGQKAEKPVGRPADTANKITPTTTTTTSSSERARGFASITEERRDVAAKAVYRMTDGAHGIPPLPDLQTQRTAPIRDAVARIMRKASGPEKGGSARVPETGGSPLPSSARNAMEPKLGADLSNARIHVGSDSASAAAQYGARAFTVGADVHFAAGEYNPGTKEGDKLIAHELTHVVQAQNSGVQRKAKSSNPDDAADPVEDGKEQVSQPGEPAEQEADAVADRVGEELHDGKEEGGDTPATGKIQAPAIAAKLAAGTVSLSKDKAGASSPAKGEDKSKAGASVKRLGKAGQDTEALKAALKQIQHERAGCLDDIQQLIAQLPKLGLSKPQAEALKNSLIGGLNGMRDHLTDDDIAGAMRDAAKDPVKAPGSGQPYDHAKEVAEGLAALTNTRANLNRVRTGLTQRQIEPSRVAALLNPALESVQRVIQTVGQAIKKIKP